jgi:hypothetical protein
VRFSKVAQLVVYAPIDVITHQDQFANKSMIHSAPFWQQIYLDQNRQDIDYLQEAYLLYSNILLLRNLTFTDSTIYCNTSLITTYLSVNNHI